MQHLFGTLFQNFRLIMLRKFRGQQPAGIAGDGETQEMSTICMMTFETRKDGSSLLVFHKIHCGAAYNEKDKYLTPTHNLKTGHHIVPNIVNTSHTVMP